MLSLNLKGLSKELMVMLCLSFYCRFFSIPIHRSNNGQLFSHRILLSYVISTHVVSR